MDKLEPPEKFSFPFEPYAIQDAFMRDIFTTIEERKIGLFESPTGTGKSLSIICGALTWLKEYKIGIETRLRNVLSQEKLLAANAKADNWLAADYECSKEKESCRSQRVTLEGLLKRELHWKKRRDQLFLQKKTKEKESDALQESLDSIESVLKECQNGGEADQSDKDLLVEDFQLEDKFGDGFKIDEEQTVIHVQKIYYATRTHSQVTQFISELKRSPFGSVTRVAALASRQNLCIFEPVQKLKSVHMINERCIELQKGSKKKCEDGTKKRSKRNPESESSCPYFSKDLFENLSNQILDEIKDIEDLTKAGIRELACPYYGSRLAVPDAEVVALPYNILFHKATREASGISLLDQVVIIDEAHNILESIAGMYSCEITEAHIRKALNQLQQYHDRYKSRLSAMNLLNIRQLLFVLEKLQNIWKRNPGSENVKTAVMNTDQFLILCGLESINLRDLLNYCDRSLIARKLMGFAERYPESTGEDSASSSSSFMFIESFLDMLTTIPADSRVFLFYESSGSKRAKFMLLNPAAFVRDVFAQARSVILAGGTMQPMSDYEDQLLLLAGVLPSRIHKFSCGHVIGPDRVLPIVLRKGPAGTQFHFSYQNRGDEGMVLQFLRLLLNVSTIIPGGIVCFFPSYDCEERMFQILVKNSELLRNVEKKKKIFREPKRSADVESVLEAYAKCISNPSENRTGAALFAVVGGKLSEGINFSDELGRCVMMVGMPYPNRFSVELQEKMDFLNRKLVKSVSGALPGEMHYENLCMKAVNQSIGRAIRHKNDYAVILLVDSRYGHPNVSRALPKWIGGQLKTADQFSEAFAEIKRFFGRLQTKI